MENQQPQPIVPTTPVAPVTPPIQNPIVTNPVIPPVANPATTPATNTLPPEHSNNIVTALLVIILILGSLGAFYFYNKSVAPVVPEVPVVENINTTVPTDTTVNNTTNVTTQKYTDKDFGFSFEYPSSLSVSTDNTGKITLVNPPGIMRNSTIIEKFTGSVANGSGKFGSNTISYVNNNWVADRQNEQTGNHYTEIISPSAYTISGLPIFFSNYTHGSGSYAYAVALSHTKFLRIVGSDEDAYIDGHYDDSKDPTYKIVKSVALLGTSDISTTLPQYVGGQSGWPPVVSESSVAYKCTPSHSEMSDTVEKNIGSRTYCITNDHEGAAGSIYHTYTYKTFGIQGSSQSTTFTLRYVGCGAYDDPRMSQCKTAQSNFNASLDTLIDSLM